MGKLETVIWRVMRSQGRREWECMLTKRFSHERGKMPIFVEEGNDQRNVLCMMEEAFINQDTNAIA